MRNQKTSIEVVELKNLKQLRSAVIITAVFELLKPNNTVTTLEVKEAVRTAYPELYTTQNDVSDAMNNLATEGLLTFTDNGSYRVYSNPAVKAKKPSASKNNVKVVSNPSEVKGKVISRTQALAFMENNKGHFFTATFVTKKNKLRTINGQYYKDQADSKLGYVKVRETSKLRKGESAIRNVNLQTLQELTIGGKTFQVG